MEVQDAHGNRVTVSQEHYDRWPDVRAKFRPVPVKATPVVVETVTPVATYTPTGDKKKAVTARNTDLS